MSTISVITVCRNSRDVIDTALESVRRQSHDAVEHIVVDGASTDDTLDIVRRFPHVAAIRSEPDTGLYDAMNKGIAMATGDIVGILNSDDFYPRPGVLGDIARAFDDSCIDATIGDVAFISPRNPNRIVRYCSARTWTPSHFGYGIMPPHPAFFVRRRHYLSLGTYRTDFRISADFDLLVRFLHVAALRFVYVPHPIVFMRPGGQSNASVSKRLLLNRETAQACSEHGIATSPGRLALRYLWKVAEFLPTWRRH